MAEQTTMSCTVCGYALWRRDSLGVYCPHCLPEPPAAKDEPPLAKKIAERIAAECFSMVDDAKSEVESAIQAELPPETVSLAGCLAHQRTLQADKKQQAEQIAALQRENRILKLSTPLEDDLSLKIDEMCKYLAMEQGFTLNGIARLFIECQRRMADDWTEVGQLRRESKTLEAQNRALREALTKAGHAIHSEYCTAKCHHECVMVTTTLAQYKVK